MKLQNLLAAAPAAALCLSLVACDLPASTDPVEPVVSESDCDRGDLAERDSDCGYWDTSSGQFVTWWWVAYGSTPPAGWVPVLPAHGSYTKPRNAKASTTVQATPRTSTGRAPRANTPRASSPTVGRSSGGTGTRTGSTGR